MRVFKICLLTSLFLTMLFLLKAQENKPGIDIKWSEEVEPPKTSMIQDAFYSPEHGYFIVSTAHRWIIELYHFDEDMKLREERVIKIPYDKNEELRVSQIAYKNDKLHIFYQSEGKGRVISLYHQTCHLASGKLNDDKVKISEVDYKGLNARVYIMADFGFMWSANEKFCLVRTDDKPKPNSDQDVNVTYTVFDADFQKLDSFQVSAANGGGIKDYYQILSLGNDGSLDLAKITFDRNTDASVPPSKEIQSYAVGKYSTPVITAFPNRENLNIRSTTYEKISEELILYIGAYVSEKSNEINGIYSSVYNNRTHTFSPFKLVELPMEVLTAGLSKDELKAVGKKKSPLLDFKTRSSRGEGGEGFRLFLEFDYAKLHGGSGKQGNSSAYTQTSRGDLVICELSDDCDLLDVKLLNKNQEASGDLVYHISYVRGDLSDGLAIIHTRHPDFTDSPESKDLYKAGYSKGTTVISSFDATGGAKEIALFDTGAGGVKANMVRSKIIDEDKVLFVMNQRYSTYKLGIYQHR